MPNPHPNSYQIEDYRDLARMLGLMLTPEFEQVAYPSPREKIIMGGWRAGKSNAMAFDLMKDIPHEILYNLTHGTSTLYWLVGPDYSQTDEEYRYIREWAAKLGILEFASNATEGPRDMRLRGNITISTKSAAYEERLGAVAPKKIGVCEAGQTSDAIRRVLLGRALQLDAPITYAGTLEDEEGHAQWAWYQELAEAWLDGKECEYSGIDGHVCEDDHISFSLPSWANKFWFPEGRNDPKIRRLEQLYDKHTFNRRIAAIPTGVQFAVYPQIGEKELCVPMAEGKPVGSAGGIDYGTVHPTALAVVQLLPDEGDKELDFTGPRGIAWVREVWFNKEDPGDTARLQSARKLLARKYSVYSWATDPNERYMARSSFAEAVSGSRSAREHRIGLVTARLNLNKLYFDMNGPGVPEAYEEMKRVHRRKRRDGLLELYRIDDDRTAAIEDAIELLDGHELLRVPRPVKLQTVRSQRRPAGNFRRIG